MNISRRFTRQRKVILDTLKATDTHPTAEDVYNRLKKDYPDLSLGTVYRNLNVLCELGEITRVDGNFPSDRFDGNNFPHYHLYCNSCKGILDLPITYASEIDENVRREAKCEIFSHSILFSGICASCLAETKSKQAKNSGEISDEISDFVLK
jgi:Fe2+ or Zn2+ uptake regulation protein